ncbi:MAG: exodeoxyribonuclease V subunit beta [Gammaproteobacteria bacterium]|nr:exodeoxyribonuclease V subunit beta [Gammaproteobacteria bacterium]
MRNVEILNAETTLSLTLDGFKLVEASAGTGKTYAIGNLYLRMLFDNYRVSEILVVTFTKAATEELRGRIRLRIYQALMHLAQPAADDAFLTAWSTSLQGDAEKIARAKGQLKWALNSMDEAAIYTIHGFCQRALTEHAFNSRQAFDVEMVTDDEQIWQLALKDWWRIVAYPLNRTSLRLFSKSLGSVEALLKLQSPLRKPRVKLLPEISDSLDSLFEQWLGVADKCGELAAIWHKEGEGIRAAFYSNALKRQTKVYKEENLPALFERLEAYFAADDPFDFPEEMSAIRASVLLAKLKKGEIGEAFNHRFFLLVDEILDDAETLQQQFRIRALADAHAWATDRVARIKQQAGQLSFNDQLVLLEQALATNRALGIQLHRRFPVAMIDEFQDTDSVQYDIFKHIYYGRTQGCLMLIGDPKQAIYGFRGGDIFTYIQAKRDATEHYTLDTNWRSTPRLVAAVNRLFSHRADPFIYDAIPFTPVLAAPKSHDLLCEQGKEITAVTLWQLPLADNGKPLTKTVAEPLVQAHTANEIARLIEAGRTGSLTLGGKAVRPGDIAVLLRSNREANDLREALRLRGVSAVASGNEPVFKSDEAAGLQLLLAAVIDFRDAGVLRRALASSLLNYHYQEIYSSIREEQPWMAWGEQFQQLHEAWSKKGFMVMFQLLLRLLNVGGRLALRHDAARRLTNLLHLGELLQQASQAISGMDALFHWFEQQIHSDGTEGLDEAVLRLESDGDLVRLVTIHASKGLEYPIVFLPYLWSCKPRVIDKNDLLPFFDERAHQHCLDAKGEEALFLAEKQRLAEDVRLAYVALTRARAKIYLAWGSAGKAGKTAMGWLLHEVQQVSDLASATPEVFKESVNITQDLNQLTAIGDIEVIPLTLDPPERVTLPEIAATIARCTATPFTGKIATDWRISSFSSLTRDVHQTVSLSSRVATEDAVFQFPAGSQTGLFLHALLEQLDFQQNIAANVLDFTHKEATRYGLEVGQAPVITAWLEDLLATPLDASGELTLGHIGTAQRLNELEFDFSVSRIDISLLNRTLDEAAAQRLQPLQMADCRGFINGVIDLVFAYQGGYYLADYKSNHLGYALEAYAPPALQQAVFERRYDLQYLIYSLALHRYLKLRVPNYSYETHFGGVYYLFLRGMRPAHGNRYGVYFVKPEKALLERLDNEIFNAKVLS